jgi:plasmid stability protein
MARLIVRHVEKGVMARLQRRARRNGRSLEDEIQEILRRTAEEESPAGGGLGTEIARLFTNIALEADIPELRGCTVKCFH